MEAKLVQRKFVHVVAMVDLAAGTGQIRYVNPATTWLCLDDPGVSRYRDVGRERSR